MIRVCKPRAPQKLASGEALTRRDCEAYQASRVDYENGTKKFEFERDIYGHKAVREALKKGPKWKMLLLRREICRVRCGRCRTLSSKGRRKAE